MNESLKIRFLLSYINVWILIVFFKVQYRNFITAYIAVNYLAFVL